jgi:hypothetical protein
MLEKNLMHKHITHCWEAQKRDIKMINIVLQSVINSSYIKKDDTIFVIIAAVLVGCDTVSFDILTAVLVGCDTVI